MQITIYTKPENLEELSNFLTTDIPYEHNIKFYEKCPSSIIGPHFTEVTLFYEDYVRLNDFKMTTNTGIINTGSM